MNYEVYIHRSCTTLPTEFLCLSFNMKGEEEREEGEEEKEMEKIALLDAIDSI